MVNEEIQYSLFLGWAFLMFEGDHSFLKTPSQEKKSVQSLRNRSCVEVLLSRYQFLFDSINELGLTALLLPIPGRHGYPSDFTCVFLLRCIFQSLSLFLPQQRVLLTLTEIISSPLLITLMVIAKQHSSFSEMLEHEIPAKQRKAEQYLNKWSHRTKAAEMQPAPQLLVRAVQKQRLRMAETEGALQLKSKLLQQCPLNANSCWKGTSWRL